MTHRVALKTAVQVPCRIFESHSKTLVTESIEIEDTDAHMTPRDKIMDGVDPEISINQYG